VQTAVATKVIGMLSEKLDGEITIEKIHFKPFTTLVLKNTLIIDKNPVSHPADSTIQPVDTFFRAEYIIAKFSLDGLLNKESIRIDMAYVDNAQMNLTLEDYPSGLVEDNYNNLSRIFRIEKPKPRKEPKEKEIFRIRKVRISDMGFAMKNMSSDPITYHGGGIDWNDLDIKDIELEADGLRFKDGIMYGKAESLSFREKTGFNCSQMSGEARVGRGKTIVENLSIRDDWSDLKLQLFTMSYRNVDDFNDFIANVKLDAEIAPSTLDFRTLANFAPQLDGNTLKATVSGSMSGVVEDFTVKDIRITSHAGGFSGTVNGRMTGIPETYGMGIDAKVSNLIFTAEGLGNFISEWTDGEDLDLSRYAKGMIFTATASAKGLLNSLKADLKVSSFAGGLKADVRIGNIIRRTSPIRISGTVDSENLDVGKILGSDLIGPVTLSTGLSADLGKSISVDMDSLHIRRLYLHGYDYREIQARGKYDTYSMNGTVISKDPNLNFIFQGGYARSEKSQNTVYKINASIGHADLNAINIDRRGKSIVQLRTNANFTKIRKGEILGRIDLGDIMLENKSGRYQVGDVVMTSHSTDNRYDIRLNSMFADASYSGTAPFTEFLKDLKGITLSRELPAITGDSLSVWNGNSYDIGFICHDVQNVLAFAAPGLYIENGTALDASIDSSGEMKASLSSRRIALKRNYLKGISLNIDNLDSSITGEVRCEEISAASITLKDNLLQIHADNDHIGAGFSFDNHSDPETKGEFIVNAAVSREEDSPIFDIQLKPSSLQYNTKEWSIQPSDIRIQNGTVDIDSFGAISGEQYVSLHGRLSEEVGDILSLNLERFDISILNSLLPSDIGVKGAVTGLASITSPLSEPEIMVDMLCDSSYIANVPLGVLKANTTWNDGDMCFDIHASNELTGKSNLKLDGRLFPGAKTIDAEINLDKLDVGYAQPLLKDIFSEMRGHISGDISVKGPLDRIAVRSTDTRLNDTWLKIAYTGVPYRADGQFHIDETGVYFNDIEIKDRYDGTGVVSGSINYDHFRNIEFDTKIKVNNIEAINIDEKDAESFYGNISGTGNLSITGPVNSITMNIDARTAKQGQLHIPMSGSLTSSKGTNLLKFKELETHEHIDPYEIFIQKTDKEDVRESDFLVKLRVNASPEVEAFVEIDKASGNVLSGRGSGNISLEASEDIFNINGDYTINSGNYKFVAMGLVSRDFQIQDGSSIRFGGDIMESTLDINAIYKTKASIATLISDTTSVTNRRVVDCGISIQDKLSNPQLSFSIEIPDLDPTIKSRVESALSTEDKVQKQFLSLIISNSFLPDEQSGIVNNTSTLYTNVTEMMANQINNIFQKLDIPLDLGLKYQPNERGNDIFDVAVSTQLFNNRVIVNGNIGNKQYQSGNTQNEVVGDIDIEIKLDRSGSFRLNLFSHSADQYTNYLDNSQRNGVGIMYQTEFNSFGRFLRNIFSGKKKRTEARMAEDQAALDEGKVNIQIERP